MSRTNPAATNGRANTHPTSPSDPTPAGNNGRDQRGRFTRGNQESRGNPFAASIAKLRKAALEVVTPTEMQGVFRVLLLRAQTGELSAMKLLFAYTLGKPSAAVDPDEVDREEPASQAEMPAVTVPARQEVAERLQEFIQQAAVALPSASWQQLVSGLAAIAENVLQQHNRSDGGDPQPCAPDALSQEQQPEPREQADTIGTPAVKETASTERDAPARSGQANAEAESEQTNEERQGQGMREALPSQAPGSDQTEHGQHSRFTGSQEATADNERGEHTTQSDTAQTTGKCGSGRTGQTSGAGDAMVVPAVRPGPVTNGKV